MKKKNISWNKVLLQLKILGKKIKKSNFNPDLLVGIIRGGLIPLRVLSTELNCSELYCIGIKYKGLKPLIFQPLNKSLKGRKVLLMDEVIDSGKTIALAKKQIQSLNPKELRTASIHLKSFSSIIPEYFAEKTRYWIVYPWEKKQGKK